MAEADYSTIPKVRRLAMFLILIGTETASELLKSFEEAEVEAISREMVSINLIDEKTQKELIEEFSSLLVAGFNSIRGGYHVTLQTLESARGPYAARNLVGKMDPTLNSKEVIAELSEMEARQIANLISGEQAQTIAFLLGSMEINKAAETLELLAPDTRSEVVLRMGMLEPTSSNILNKVVKNLSRHIEGNVQKSMVNFGGASRVAALLNKVDKSLSKALLSELEESNATLGAKVRRKMFSFNDLVNVPPDVMQRILREVDSSVLLLAMRPAPGALKDKIFGSLSKRAAESLQEELDMMGSVRLKEVEAAQDSIIEIVRKLEEGGEINLGDNGDDALV
jgi:flagellar motor switch protein FliG